MHYGHWTAAGLFAFFLATVVSVSESPAQSPLDGPSDHWELTVIGGIMDDTPEFDQEQGSFQLEHEGVVGGRLGRHFGSGAFLEVDVLYAPLELAFRRDDRRERERLQALFFGGAFGYSVRLMSQTSVFARGGLGGVSWNADPDGEVDFAISGGGGVRYVVSRHLAIRWELRWHLVPAGLAATRRAILPEVNSPSRMIWLSELSAGPSITF